MTWLHRLFTAPDPVIGWHIPGWQGVRADRAAEATDRLLLGACGPVQVVGHRPTEALLADRERRAQRMSGGQRGGKVLPMVRG